MRDREPASPSRPAATSPAGPAPSTTTSKLRSATRRVLQMSVCDDRGVTTTIDPRELLRLMSHGDRRRRDHKPGRNEPRGATTNALTSLSLQPLLVLVALDRGSNTLRRSAIPLGSASTSSGPSRRSSPPLCDEGERRGEARGGRRLIDEVPVLNGTVAWLACELERAGGRRPCDPDRPTARSGADPEARPLVFYGGRYHAGTLDGP